MKTVLISAAIALTLSATAHASSSLNLNGQVDSVCTVSNLTNSQTFSSLSSGATAMSDVTLLCNDADGATVSLTSAEGNLQNTDNENRGIDYKASLTAGAVALELMADTGENEKRVSVDVDGSEELARGVNGQIQLELLEDALYAGTYSDTLQIAITAR
ncbi:hypothetical protein W04_2755 [Pseudoalteromonas sp. SW0106-04]|uniref:hypothetical protein n=1 Tax=Pseudoalteromonas sp. SW0106-04 TaxID=1702169 RepID=UPI0006B402F8|nr:hypothetical protein [Pseudoalteromonas sp. SW0106-04]GAP76208.1 hypothetical protein W04_2755 [Pseudoalteromonas sp. SW0106-04]